MALRLRSTTGKVSLDGSAHFKPGESHIGFFLFKQLLGAFEPVVLPALTALDGPWLPPNHICILLVVEGLVLFP